MQSGKGEVIGDACAEAAQARPGRFDDEVSDHQIREPCGHGSTALTAQAPTLWHRDVMNAGKADDAEVQSSMPSS